MDDERLRLVRAVVLRGFDMSTLDDAQTPALEHLLREAVTGAEADFGARNEDVELGPGAQELMMEQDELTEAGGAPDAEAREPSWNDSAFVISVSERLHDLAGNEPLLADIVLPPAEEAMGLDPTAAFEDAGPPGSVGLEPFWDDEDDTR